MYRRVSVSVAEEGPFTLHAHRSGSQCGAPHRLRGPDDASVEAIAAERVRLGWTFRNSKGVQQVNRWFW